jgi:hypothetical protein
MEPPPPIIRAHRRSEVHTTDTQRTREMNRPRDFGSARVPQIAAGSRRGPSRPTPRVLAVREHTRGAVLRCGHDGDGRRSGALLGARAGVVDRRLGCGRRHGQLWLPSAVLFALRPGQAASVLAPVAAPGTALSGHLSRRIRGKRTELRSSLIAFQETVTEAISVVHPSSPLEVW